EGFLKGDSSEKGGDHHAKGRVDEVLHRGPLCDGLIFSFAQKIVPRNEGRSSGKKQVSKVSSFKFRLGPKIISGNCRNRVAAERHPGGGAFRSGTSGMG